MDSFIPPNNFQPDSDDEDLYVPTKVDKGKRRVDDPYDAPSNGSPIFSNESVDYGHKHSDGFRRSSDNISIDIDEEQGGFCSDGDDSQSTASARFPIGTNPRADDAGSDSDVSFYESVDADLPSTAVSDDQTDADLPSAVASDYQVDVDVPVPQHDELDLAYSIRECIVFLT
ncbi:hypothetical protein PAXINDRAFT_103797 [Paxillus involutus ATCC 200175]|uniref:Uncharacterized protein n=1 Tax=Paxillus involutus ATCC 200175 TaxID=664439 RepID=A0A0C9T1I5_PAXIN|nr:hypothetical protein PAXINDRAFT_103797 [Paxillus involutus ATCC 200175]